MSAMSTMATKLQRLQQVRARRLALLAAVVMVMVAGAAVLQAAPLGVSQEMPVDSNTNNGTHGGPRGPAYPVQVIVKLNDQAVAGVKVTLTDRHSASAVTGPDGVASFQLAPGTYKVTASGSDGTGTATAHVVKSTDPLVVAVVLTPKGQ